MSQENRSLQESYQQEFKNRSRLSLHNEELQYKLKHNSEKFTMALGELSIIHPERSMYLSECKKSLYGSIQELHFSPADRSTANQTANGSPPTSPVVKGVVEKNDSVSYVLEINDDESAEALAERMIKRAGSFRVNVKERSPAFKRQYSLGANALCQSSSATSVLRRISESPIKNSDGTPKQPKSSRTRSNSLNVSAEAGCSKWTETMQSTPIMHRTPKKSANGHSRPMTGSLTRSSSVSTEDADDDAMLSAVSQNASNSMLVTCSKRSAERFGKKRQQIKEAGGEAMVAQRSYTNSDDEHSLGSNSMSASPSNSTSPSHSDGAAKAHQLTLEDEALMHKIVTSLSTRSTPMEVSWSEDGDNDLFGVQNESSA